MKKKIRKILVANRGEIALRIMRTCREMGIGTVAVYSDADISTPHVRFADESYRIGPAPAAQSYLQHQAIIDTALKTGADAIHPGYGFLSENAAFVEAVTSTGLIFIGPGPEAIRRMGDKTAARKLATSLDVPITPGTTESVSSAEEAAKIAAEIGFPVLIKAAGGGGGKGMRVVRIADELPSALRASQSEARSAFGDDRVYIERYITNPHHIEVQILADRHGNAVHLGERECSIQRRHQKIIEESPSPIMTDDLREQMTSSAIRLVKSSGYVNAGTIEFIVDDRRNFYFLEMNTRLQVEHPVTEMRVGLDLVAEQIRIAQGEKLSFTQSDIRFNGHAVECRIYAEDPENSFFPSTGQVEFLRAPAGPGIREDRGIDEGDAITTYYDPMIAKLIAWGRTRQEALNRCSSALGAYRIFGLRHNIRLCRWILGHPQFAGGEYTTGFIAEQFDPVKLQEDNGSASRIAAILAVVADQHTPAPVPESAAVASRWKQQRGGWR